MKIVKRLARKLKSLTAPYDVPADHAFSRESIAKQRAVSEKELQKVIDDAESFVREYPVGQVQSALK
jgi:hypothetical protein